MITAYLTCFRYYPTAYLAQRTDFSSDAWYTMIQNNINTNMPLQYEVPNHTAVPAFPWRYINVDTGGGAAVFEAGQLIQSLPEKKVVCTSTTGGAIKFYGTATQSTRLFTSGDTSRGILISGGCLALYGGGGIFLH